MPFQTVAERDDGYDVTDYYGVDPRFGTLGDFVEFTHGAEQRGIRVIIDLVVNHTSDEHPWFKEARARSPNSRYRDWYVWSDKKPRERNKGDGLSRRAEVDLDATTRRRRRGTSIASTTSSPTSTPPIPRCRPRSCKIMGFWLQLGVVGLSHGRGAVRHRNEGRDVQQADEQFDMLRELRDFLQWRQRRRDHPRRGQRACPTKTWTTSATTAIACT